MGDYRFNSLDELYKKLLPALSCKVHDLKKENCDFIKEEDIWNYLRTNIWNKKTKLTLGELADDILHVSKSDLINYRYNNTGGNVNVYN